MLRNRTGWDGFFGSDLFIAITTYGFLSSDRFHWKVRYSIACSALSKGDRNERQGGEGKRLCFARSRLRDARTVLNDFLGDEPMSEYGKFCGCLDSKRRDNGKSFSNSSL